MGSCLSTPKKQKNKSAPARRARNDENTHDMVALRPATINNINTRMYEDLKAHKEECERLSRETKERLDEMQKSHEEQLEEKNGQISELNDVLTKQVTDVGYNKNTWYTLSSELNSLAGKLRDLTAFMKLYFNPENKPTDDIVEFFKTCWTEDLGYDDKRRETTIRQVEKLFRDKPTYEVVGVLVEKLLSDYFVHKIYLVPLHTGFHEENKAYECIDDLLKEKNADTVKKVRVMMSNAISDRIQNDTAWKEMRAKSKKELTEEIISHLGKIYNPKKIKSKVKDIVFKAVSLNLPMHTQRYDIIIHNLETDEELYTNEVELLIPYDVNSNKVFLGIYPVIYADEDPLENDDEDSDDNEDQEDEEVSGGSEDEHPISKKETKKGKQQKQKKIVNKGTYQQKYSVMKGKAVGYELR